MSSLMSEKNHGRQPVRSGKNSFVKNAVPSPHTASDIYNISPTRKPIPARYHGRRLQDTEVPDQRASPDDLRD